MAQYNFKMALCDGRHEIKEAAAGGKVKGEVNPLAVDRLENMAFNSLWNKCHKAGILEYASSKYPALEGTEEADSLCIPRGLSVDLYVTGLTVALVAVLNVCRQEGVDVTLWHFNRETGEYYPQEVK